MVPSVGATYAIILALGTSIALAGEPEVRLYKGEAPLDDKKDISTHLNGQLNPLL